MDTPIQVNERFAVLKIVKHGSTNGHDLELSWYEQVDGAFAAELLYYHWLSNAFVPVHEGKGEYDLFILMIIYEMNRELGEGAFGIKEIAERMFTNYKTVQQAVKRLVEFGALEFVGRPDRKTLFHILLGSS